jgi:hypothetical protein
MTTVHLLAANTLAVSSPIPEEGVAPSAKSAEIFWTLKSLAGRFMAPAAFPNSVCEEEDP